MSLVQSYDNNNNIFYEDLFNLVKGGIDKSKNRKIGARIKNIIEEASLYGIVGMEKDIIREIDKFFLTKKISIMIDESKSFMIFKEFGIDISDGIDPYTKDFIPIKVERIADVLWKNTDKLLMGEYVKIKRKDALHGMECRRYVSDNQIIYMVRDKLTICLRENVYGMKNNYFRKGVMKVGWLRDVVTKDDDDRVIYIKFLKIEEKEITAIDDSECVMID